MKRVYAALAIGLILAVLLPSVVSADRVTKFTDHYVFANCEAPFDGGFASASLELGTDFRFSAVGLWFDPEDPFEMEPTVGGFTEAFDVGDDGTTVEVDAVIPMTDAEGNPEPDADLTITLTRTGDIFTIGPDTGKTNYNSKTTGMEEGLEGSGTISWNGSEFELPECSGVVGDIDVFSTNPRGFVTANTGVVMTCFWETESAFASLFAANDGFGFFADASLSTAELELFSLFGESSGAFDVDRIDVDIPLEDGLTGDLYSGAATATFTPNGSPVTSTHVSENAHSRVTEQALDPTGTLEFSTGDEFAIDDEHCDARWFDAHSTGSSPAGPKRAPAPENDTPEGAIALDVGSRLNTSNVGATPEPEFQVENCPEGFADQFGRTLWYTIEGSGSPITIDTAGSGFDTLIAVYLPTDPGFEEIACIDDVELDPVGSSFQAALTFDTGEGVTYYVQVGGYDFPFDEEVNAQKGRLRIRVD